MSFAIKLIIHTIKLIFNNLKQALHITVPALLAFVAFFLFLGFGAGLVFQGDWEGGPLPGLFAFLGVLVFFILFGAVAIAWHRYVLLDEEPRGLFPMSLNWNAARYVGRSILIFLMTGLPTMVLIMIIMAGMPGISGTPGLAALLVILALLLCFVYAYFRFFVSLPSIAVGNENFGIFDAWEATANHRWTILWVVVFIFVGQSAVGYLMSTIAFNSLTAGAGGIPIFVTVLNIVWQWFVFMFSICIITTLYGICVERRKI